MSGNVCKIISDSSWTYPQGLSCSACPEPIQQCHYFCKKRHHFIFFRRLQHHLRTSPCCKTPVGLFSHRLFRASHVKWKSRTIGTGHTAAMLIDTPSNFHNKHPQHHDFQVQNLVMREQEFQISWWYHLGRLLKFLKPECFRHFWVDFPYYTTNWYDQPAVLSLRGVRSQVQRGQTDTQGCQVKDL